MEISLIVLMTIVTALVSAAETALFAVRRIDLMKWRSEGNRRGRIVERLLEAPSKLITTIFIVNEFTNVAISSLIAVLAIRAFARHGEIVALAGGTAVILVLGDLIPKVLAWGKAPAFSLLVARPLHLLSRLLAPVRFLIEKTADGIVYVLSGGRAPDAAAGLSEREIRALVDEGEEAGTLDEGEKQLIHNIFELTDRRAGEIMTPNSDVFMVPASLPYDELLENLRKYRRSRIPVYDGDPRNVIGILHFKELLRTAGGGSEAAPSWLGLVAPPFVVPTSKKLPLLLREFQKRKVHLALVADEFGDIVGIVTLEDVLEELFGDIREEHDREETEIARRPDGTYRVLGRTPVHRFNEAFEADLSDQEWDTIAGVLLHTFGRLPAKGDSVVIAGFRFTVERLKGIRIAEVGVQRLAYARGRAAGPAKGE